MGPRGATRSSTSAIPERIDPSFFELPEDTPSEYSTRHSLVSFTRPPKRVGSSSPPSHFDTHRESGFSDVSGMEPLQFWHLGDDLDTSRVSGQLTPRTMMQNDPYQGICIEVNNHSINNQGVVLYHVDIKGPEGMLSTYTIRRRYRAFKHLHEELGRMMTLYATATAKMKNKDTEELSSVPYSPHSLSHHRQVQQQYERYGGITLPSLPSAGVWTYLKRHDLRLVEQRKKRFQEILRIAIEHPATKHSTVLDTFLSVAPSMISQRNGSSYVSLQDYSVPVFDRQRESIERKQRKQRVLQGRRHSEAIVAERPEV